MSEAIDRLEIHASGVTAWQACPARERFKQKNKVPPTFIEDHVGSVVGNMVHAKVTGHEYTVPKTMTFDTSTPSLAEAKRQADRMAEIVFHFFELNGIEVLKSEVPLYCVSEYNKVQARIMGKIDLLCSRAGEKFILDLKTGKNKPGNVYTQLAMYAYLVAHSNVIDEIHTAGVLWVSRKKTPAFELYQEKPAKPLVGVAAASIKELVLFKISDTYPYNPSTIACAHCPHKHCPAKLDKADPTDGW